MGKIEYFIRANKNGFENLYDEWYDENGKYHIYNYEFEDTIVGRDIFMKLLSPGIEVFARDFDAINGYSIDMRLMVEQTTDSKYRTKNNSQLYVILLIYNDEPTGSIYCWEGIENTNILYSMGVKGRIDNELLPPKKKRLKNTTSYIFEGVRLLAIEKNKKYQVVTSPSKIMIPILYKNDFIKRILFDFDSYNGLSYKRWLCDFCYERSVDK